ncbi:iron ABC transporter substrate-binding protein [Methylocapsa polymorpha]|uniref:Iron ABC transporter substrate-binding protein n=1 Tax=Methylocapsa polymorpha TaxID=3080828 RepID=A0ABZ0HNQ0_9HYPH|nr:iron ABC transporter substrate-binding protein [Methylocapsa sp. RX1]
MIPARKVLIAAALVALSLFAPPALSEPPTPPPAQKFIDAVGRSVDLPAHVERVIPAGPPAVVLVYALAPEKLLGLLESWTESRRAFVPEAYRGLPVLPRLTRAPSDADLALLRGQTADLIVDYGDIGKAYAASAERAQAALGVPSILLEGRMAETPEVLHSLGVILEKKERGDELAALAEHVLERLHPASSIDPERRVAVYLGRGPEGLLAVRPGGLLSEPIEAAGGRNVTPEGPGAFAQLNVAEAAALHPAVVILEDPSAADGPLSKALDPKTVILVDRGGPFGSMEAPPSINRLIGALALAAILHPDLAPPDPRFMRALRENFFGPLPKEAPLDPLERAR